MVEGISLIIIGIIGAICTLIFTVKFMKKNSFILKGDYIDYSIEETHNKKLEKMNLDINILTNNSLDTELLDNSLDTELLDDNNGSDTELLENSYNNNSEIFR